MERPKKKPWLAGLLSFLVAGMGQVYNRKYKKGILLFVLNVVFYFLYGVNPWLVLGSFIIWVYAIYDAYKTAKKTITEEPYKHAIWITVVIFVGLVMMFAGMFYLYFLYFSGL